MVLRCAAPQRRDYAAVHHYVAASLFISYTAILVLPGLKNGDLALSTMVRQTFPPWFLGVVGGAGPLTAMVPRGHPDTERRAALFAKSFFRSVFKPSMKDDDIAKLAKVMAVVMAGIAVYFATYSSTTLVGLLLLAYAQRQSSTLSG
jgi:SSS family solute:Na+ symporter